MNSTMEHDSKMQSNPLWKFNLTSGYADSDADEEIANQNNDIMQGVVQTDTHSDNDDQNEVQVHAHSAGDARAGAEQQDFNEAFPQGFSDDDDGSHGKAFNRTFKPGKARKQPLKQNNKSPRRSEDDENVLVENPRANKARKSLFGASEQRYDEADEEHHDKRPNKDRNNLFGEDSHQTEDETDTATSPRAPKSSIRKRMSSLNLSQEDEEWHAGPSRTSRNFGLTLSDDDSPRAASPARSEHSYTMPDAMRREMEKNPYELRKTVNRQVSSTWLDLDQTGNYDPEEEARQKQLMKQRTKERKKKGKQGKAPKERIPKYIIKLPFRAIGTVLNIVDQEENWPDGWSDVDSEEERQEQARRAFYRLNTPGIEPQDPIEDPAGEVDDLTGYPDARGCKGCRKHGGVCSMIDGGAWPCDQCDNDKIDCEPIIKPKRKGKCERCRDTCGEDEENVCSFELHAMEPHDICEQCVEADCMDCVAGPPEGYKTPRIDLTEIMYGRGRKHTNCTNCRMTKKRCSVKKKTDRGPCNQCRKAKIGCTFYDVPKVPMPKKEGKKKIVVQPEQGESSRTGTEGASAIGGSGSFWTQEDLWDLEEFEDQDDEEAEREPTPEFEMEDAQGRKGKTTRIDTCFAHPIQFNTMGMGAPDCNFCHGPTFSFLGLSEKNVHVLRWDNGLGFSELQGGHREENDPTTMCSECVESRLQIISCPAHDMNQTIDNAELDFNSLAEMLMIAEPRSAMMQTQLQRWCSMCFTPATFECITPQPSICAPEGLEDEAVLKGCGLRLCDRCEVRLREDFDGDCYKMAAAYDKEPKARADEDESGIQGVVRADVGFLMAEGLLMKAVEHQSLAEN